MDRFLEHTRAFCFHNDGQPEYYISSADWMTRNLNRRVEVTVPIYDEKIKRQLRDHFEILWKDNTKSRIFDANQSNAYRKLNGPKNPGPIGYARIREEAAFKRLENQFSMIVTKLGAIDIGSNSVRCLVANVVYQGRLYLLS